MQTEEKQNDEQNKCLAYLDHNVLDLTHTQLDTHFLTQVLPLPIGKTRQFKLDPMLALFGMAAESDWILQL